MILINFISQMIKKSSKSNMKSLEEIVNEIGRRYVEQRMEIEQRFLFEFDTEKTRKTMSYMIEQCERLYKEELRQKKLEHLLDDTIFRK
jgi:hypothetical protein